MGKRLENMTSKKLYIYYFISSILIVYMHCNPLQWNISTSTSTGDIFSFVDYCIQTCTCCAVPFFFICSGFLLYKSLSLKKLKQTIYVKFKRYAIPFLLWSIICFVTIDYLRNMDLNYFLIYVLSSSFDGPLWFIEILAIFIVLSPLFLLLLHNKKIGFFIVIAFLIVQYYLTFSFSNPSLRISLLIPYIDHLKIAIPYYFLGCFLGKYYFDEINNEKYDSKILRVIALVCLIILYLQYFNNFPIRVIGIAYDILNKSQCILFWIVFPKKHFNYKDYWWYHRTFFTYASQWLFIYATTKLISDFIVTPMLISPFYFLQYRLLITLVISIITIVLGQIIYLFSPNIYHFLTGETVEKKAIRT